MSCSGTLHPLPPNTPPQSIHVNTGKRINDTPFQNPRVDEAAAAIKLNLLSDPIEKTAIGYARLAKDMEREVFGAVHPRRFLDELMPYNEKTLPSEKLSKAGGIEARSPGTGRDLTQDWEELIVRIV
jgi:hypothetical protein